MTQEKLEYLTGRQHTRDMMASELDGIDLTAFSKKIKSTQKRIAEDKISPVLQWQKQLEGYDADKLALDVISICLGREDEMIFQAAAMAVCRSALGLDYTKEAIQTASNLISYLSDIGLYTIEQRPGYSPMGQQIMQHYIVRTKTISGEIKDRVNSDLASIPMVEEPLNYDGAQDGGGRLSFDETCFTNGTRAKTVANTEALDVLDDRISRRIRHGQRHMV